MPRWQNETIFAALSDLVLPGAIKFDNALVCDAMHALKGPPACPHSRWHAARLSRSNGGAAPLPPGETGDVFAAFVHAFQSACAGPAGPRRAGPKRQQHG